MPEQPSGTAITPATQLHQLIAHQARVQPTAVALWWQGRAIDYTTLHRRVLDTAGRFAAHGKAGDRVAVLAWNCPEFVELMYAVPAAGRILVPLNARLAPAEWCYQLQTAGITTVVGEAAMIQQLSTHPHYNGNICLLKLGPEYEEWLSAGVSATLPRCATSDPAWILYTSGSTGSPKGAMLSHQSLLAGLRSAALGRPVLQDDKYYYPFPLFHVAAHNVLLQHKYGAAVVLAKSFDAGDTLIACRELNITTLSLAPTMIARLLQHPDFTPADLASVRTIGYGASAMPETLLQKLLRETSVGLCQSYGMTELSGSIAFLTVADHKKAASGQPGLLQSVGSVLPTAEVKLIDDRGHPCATGVPGEILVRAQQCFAGYWNDEDATRSALVDGWLHTGDIGRFGAAGYLYIVDRKKDMIISGGENIASREVEETLRQHPAVTDCAVIGVPDSEWGEACAAVVLLNKNVSDKELIDHCRQSLAGYKTPRRFMQVDDLPLNSAGKIDKPLLRQRYENR